MTPEGRVKKAVRKVLKPYIDNGDVYDFWPVQTGFGKKSLDILICVHGLFVAVETKRPGKDLTPLQDVHRRLIEGAGGKVFKIDSVDGTGELERFLLHSTCGSQQ